MPESIFIKLGMYIMAPEPISTVYLINLSHQSVSICLLLSLQDNGSVKCIPPFGARQRLGKDVPRATNTRNSGRIFGGVMLYAVRVLYKESLCIPLSLLGAKWRRFRSNEELLEASFSMRCLSYQRKVCN
jgi:hypothetical protein